MTKICIFVEGQTELIFTEKLLNKYLTPPDFEIGTNKLTGDRTIEIRGRNRNDVNLYILLTDVGCGERVVSALVDRSDQMINERGYNCLIALRDLYPICREKKNDVIEKTQSILDKCTNSDKLKHVLAVMEIEAWFLGDHNMFKKIDSKLTPEYIEEKIGKNLIEEDPETYKKPSQVIKDIYKLIGKKYSKTKDQVHQITHRIDYAFLYGLDAHNPPKIKSFFFFLKCINEALDAH